MRLLISEYGFDSCTERNVINEKGFACEEIIDWLTDMDPIDD